MSRGDSQKIELGQGVFAMEQVYETKPRPEGFFETHRKYIDLQVVIAGEEVMEVIDASRLTVREAYNPERDLVIYADTARAARLQMLPEDAAIYFPADAHMGSLRRSDAAVLVRKVVVKIPVS